MKHFKEFNDRGEYDSYINSGSIVLPNVSLVHNETHDVVNGMEIDENVKPTLHYNKFDIGNIPNVDFGWVCYYDGNHLKLCDYTTYTGITSTKYPVGVVVVPSKHLNDGTVRICALNDLSGTKQWANPSGLNITVLTDFNKVTRYDNTNGGTTTLSEYGFLPSDDFNSTTNHIQCNSDTGASYNPIVSAGTYHNMFIPSPYANDGSKYEDYSYQNSANALLDLNGLKNTNILKSLNEMGDGTTDHPYYPAATGCTNYHQENDNGIKWYLPACGELAYVVPRKKIINQRLVALGGHAFVADTYWSSSEYSDASARRVDMDRGNVYYSYKSRSRYVRPFAKVVVSPFSF